MVRVDVGERGRVIDGPAATPVDAAMVLVGRRVRHQVADDLVFPGTTAAELRLRLAMLARRSGGAPESAIRLGPLVINTESYQVTVDGSPLDLTLSLRGPDGKEVVRNDDLPGTTRDGDVHVMGELKAAWFKDLDGNILNLVNQAM